MRQSDTREINAIITKLGGWERWTERRAPYGLQRGFKRCEYSKNAVLQLENASVTLPASVTGNNKDFVTDVTVRNDV